MVDCCGSFAWYLKVTLTICGLFELPSQLHTTRFTALTSTTTPTVFFSLTYLNAYDFDGGTECVSGCRSASTQKQALEPERGGGFPPNLPQRINGKLKTRTQVAKRTTTKYRQEKPMTSRGQFLQIGCGVIYTTPDCRQFPLPWFVPCPQS
jgi:hypothetical protein